MENFIPESQVICSNSLACGHGECSHWQMHTRNSYCADDVCEQYNELVVRCIGDIEEWDQ